MNEIVAAVQALQDKAERVAREQEKEWEKRS